MAKIKKRVIGAVFAAAVMGCVAYGGHKIYTMGDRILTDNNMITMAQACKEMQTRDMHGCVLSKMLWAVPAEMTYGLAFIGMAAGMWRYRQRILKLH